MTEQEGAGQEGAGQEGTGQEGAGQEGAGQEGAGQEGTGQEGAGQEGAGQEGAGQEGGMSESSGSPGAPAGDAAPVSSANQEGGEANSDAIGKPGDSPANVGDSSSTNGSSAGSGPQSAGDEPPPEADPANMEYAKRSTDMVLDYLEQNRDKPDSDLLKKLNWSEEDLRAFEERWKNTREMPKSEGAGAQREFEEALQSLGLRNRESEAVRQRQPSDAMRGLEDAGTRVPAPPLYRDAFEAFRRSSGQ